jgi:hypothetical protein
MNIKDPHDKREFRRYVKLNDDGTVAAIVDVAAGLPPPTDSVRSVYVDITDFKGVDLHTLAVHPDFVTDHAAATYAAEIAQEDLQRAQQAVAEAQDRHARATADIHDALKDAMKT